MVQSQQREEFDIPWYPPLSAHFELTLKQVKFALFDLHSSFSSPGCYELGIFSFAALGLVLEIVHRQQKKKSRKRKKKGTRARRNERKKRKQDIARRKAREEEEKEALAALLGPVIGPGQTSKLQPVDLDLYAADSCPSLSSASSCDHIE